MSWKLYDAFKVKERDRVWRVLEDIRDRGEHEVVARLTRYYHDFINRIDPEDETYVATREKDRRNDLPDHATRLRMAHDSLRDGFKKSATSMHRDFFDPDVNVALTWHETGFYLRAFCDRVSLLGGSLDFLQRHPDLEDFHFQDQTDKPEDVPEADWEERRRIWTEMCVPPGLGSFSNQVVLEICNWGKWWQLDPWLEISRECYLHPPTFPSREEVFAQRLRRLEAFVAVSAKAERIEATTKDGGAVVIERSGERWTSRIGDDSWLHPRLDNAVNWVEYQHMPAFLRAIVDSASPNTIEKNLLRDATDS